MKSNHLKKLIIGMMLVTTMVTTLQPKPAQGFFGMFDWMNGLIQGIGHSIQGSLLGIDATSNTVSAGLQSVDRILEGIPLEYGAVRRSLSTASTACDLSDGGFVVNLVDDLASSVAGVGDQTKATSTLFISRRLVLLNAKLACYTAVSESYQTAMVGATFDEQIKKAFADVLTEIEQRRAPIAIQITELQDQQKTAVQDIFKAIAVSVAMDVNEQYTANAINELKPKLALGSYGKTIDALTNQVYAIEYIKKNYEGDQSKQLIMNSILDTDLLPSSADKKEAVRTTKALIRARLAEQNCPSSHELMDWNDPQSLSKAANYMSHECNVEAQLQAFQDEFAQLKANSKSSAQLEVSNGGGFQSTRSCKDVTAQETQIRSITREAARKLEAASLRVDQIERSKATNSAQYIEAINQRTAAQTELNAVPQKVGGGVVIACGRISDPGSFVEAQLNNYVESWLKQTTDIKESNLPLFAQLAKTVSRKLFKGIILNPDKSNEVLTELGSSFLNATLTGAIDNSPNLVNPTSNQVNITNGQISTSTTNLDTGVINGYIVPKGQTVKTNILTPGQEYSLVIDISKVQTRFNTPPLEFKVVDETSRINLEDTITDADRNRGNFILDFTANNNTGTFTITVYGRIAPDPKARLATTSVNYQPAVLGAVQGAQTRVPLVPFINPRGK